jgi:uncharacterized protein (DUF1778 family)
MATIRENSRRRPSVVKQGRQSRLEVRITATQKALIERAAAYEGRSVTDFVVSAVTAASQAAIERHEVIRLNPAQSEAFVKSLLNPSPPNAALRRAARVHRRSVESR